MISSYNLIITDLDDISQLLAAVPLNLSKEIYRLKYRATILSIHLIYRNMIQSPRTYFPDYTISVTLLLSSGITEKL